MKVECFADAAATAREEDLKDTLSRTPHSRIASQVEAATAVEGTQRELINRLERTIKTESALEDNISSRTAKATIAAAVAATAASATIRKELAAALEHATIAENALTAAAVTTVEEMAQASAKAIEMMIEGETASGQAPPATATMVQDILCREG